MSVKLAVLVAEELMIELPVLEANDVVVGTVGEDWVKEEGAGLLVDVEVLVGVGVSLD